MTDPRARLPLEESPGFGGPLRWVVLGCLVTLLIGLVIFILVSREPIGDPDPGDGSDSVERDNQRP